MLANKRKGPVDLSVPDNSQLNRGRSIAVEILWWYLGRPLLRSSLIPASTVKCMVLRLFGATIDKGVYIKPGVTVKFPWYLTIGAYSWIGENVWIDNLTTVAIGAHVCVSQDAYICTGNHDWATPNMKLFARSINLEPGSWVGARCTVCPGVSLGTGAIAGVGSVVNRPIPAFEIWSGNPAVFVRKRVLHEEPS